MIKKSFRTWLSVCLVCALLLCLFPSGRAEGPETEISAETETEETVQEETNTLDSAGGDEELPDEEELPDTPEENEPADEAIQEEEAEICSASFRQMVWGRTGSKPIKGFFSGSNIIRTAGRWNPRGR